MSVWSENVKYTNIYKASNTQEVRKRTKGFINIGNR